MPTIRVDVSEDEYFELLRAKRKMGCKSWREFVLELYRSHTLASAQSEGESAKSSIPHTHAPSQYEAPYLEPISSRRAVADEVFVDVVRLLEKAGWTVRPGSKVKYETIAKAILKVRHASSEATARKYISAFLKLGWLTGSTPGFLELTEKGYKLAERYVGGRRGPTQAEAKEDEGRHQDFQDAVSICELEELARKLWGVLKEAGELTPRNIGEKALREAVKRAGITPAQLRLLESAGLIRKTEKGYDIVL